MNHGNTHTASAPATSLYITSAEISHLAKSKVSGHRVYSPFSLLGSSSRHKKERVEEECFSYLTDTFGGKKQTRYLRALYIAKSGRC